MTNALCQRLGIEFPLFAFSHCRDVVAAVSKAGGFGVLGATAFNPEQLEVELQWIDAHVDGKPYGIDVLIPENLSVKDEKGLTSKKLAERIPAAHTDFVRDLLARHGVEEDGAHARTRDDSPPPFWPEEAMELLRVAFKHPIKMIVNALGVPPPAMIQMGRDHGVPVGALAGAKEHALRLAAAGCDVIVAQGGEAGGHCGEVSTLVLIPEVVRALKREGHNIPVLAWRWARPALGLAPSGSPPQTANAARFSETRWLRPGPATRSVPKAAPANTAASSSPPGPTPGKGQTAPARSPCPCNP